MPRLYSGTSLAISPAVLSDEMLLSIGRLVRAFADTEDLILMYICKLANVKESIAITMLGKSGLKIRLDMARYLAEMIGKESAQLHDAIFNAGFREALECRNAVAHGRLLGQTEDGRYAFLTSKTEAPTGNSAIQLAISYSLEGVANYAKSAEEALPLIVKHLKLAEQQAKRPQQDLQPHRKGRIPRTPSSKPKRPPRSS